MNGKCEIHGNQTWPVFYGTQQCVKVWKDLVERYFNYYPETKSVTDEQTNGHEDPYIPPTLVERGYKKPPKYHTVRTVLKSNQNHRNRGKINTSNTHIHNHSLSWVGTGTSEKVAGLN